MKTSIVLIIKAKELINELNKYERDSQYEIDSTYTKVIYNICWEMNEDICDINDKWIMKLKEILMSKIDFKF